MLSIKNFDTYERTSLFCIGNIYLFGKSCISDFCNFIWFCFDGYILDFYEDMPVNTAPYYMVHIDCSVFEHLFYNNCKTLQKCILWNLCLHWNIYLYPLFKNRLCPLLKCRLCRMQAIHRLYKQLLRQQQNQSLLEKMIYLPLMRSSQIIKWENKFLKFSLKTFICNY